MRRESLEASSGNTMEKDPSSGLRFRVTVLIQGRDASAYILMTDQSDAGRWLGGGRAVPRARVLAWARFSATKAALARSRLVSSASRFFLRTSASFASRFSSMHRP
eukprot:6454765-Pyramimonas_sp.AAC.1